MNVRKTALPIHPSHALLDTFSEPTVTNTILLCKLFFCLIFVKSNANESRFMSFVAGVINTDGKLWKDQRKFVNDRLRQFGVTCLGEGKKLMEARIMVSAHLMNVFEREKEFELS